MRRRGAAVAGVLAVLVLTGIIRLPSISDLLAGLSDSLGAWTYGVVPGLAFLETAAFLGLLIPGETAVLVGGMVAERGEISVVALIVLVWAAAVAGDLLSFLLGRRLGGGFVRRHAGRLRVKLEDVDRVERLFERHGGKTIVLGRFVGVVRTFTPFVAGTSGMALRRFFPYSVGAALVWSVACTLLGYAFSSSVFAAGDLVAGVALAALVLAAVVVPAVRARRARAVTPRPTLVHAPSGGTSP